MKMTTSSVATSNSVGGSGVIEMARNARQMAAAGFLTAAQLKNILANLT